MVDTYLQFPIQVCFSATIDLLDLHLLEFATWLEFQEKKLEAKHVFANNKPHVDRQKGRIMPFFVPMI